MSYQQGLGRLTRVTRLLKTGVVAATIFTLQGALASAAFITSKDGRLSANPLPAKNWCGETVSLRVDAPPGLASSEPALLRQFMLGVRTAVATECPIVAGIRMHGHKGDKPAFWAYFSKENHWAPTVVEADSLASEDIDPQTRRRVALIDAKAFNAASGAQHVTILANTRKTVDAEWRVSNVRAALTFVPLGGRAGGVHGMVREAISKVAATCTEIGGASLDLTSQSAEHESFVCRQKERTFAFGVLGYTYGKYLFVLALYSPRADIDKGTNLAAVLAAYRKVLIENW